MSALMRDALTLTAEVATLRATLARRDALLLRAEELLFEAADAVPDPLQGRLDALNADITAELLRRTP